MVLPRSPEFDATVREPHTAIALLELMEGDQVTDEIEAQDFTVALDAKAAQLRSLDVALPGEDDLIPASLADKLAPGGTRVRASRGVRIQNIVAVGGPIITASQWTPTTEYGVLNGAVAEPDGAITLGWPD